MVLERAIIEKARPQVLAAKLGEYVNSEGHKGCSPEIYPLPVPQEPPYNSINDYVGISSFNSLQYPNGEDLYYLHKLTRLKIWISPEYAFDWKRAESFVKLLQQLEHRVCFEIWGNSKEITFNLLCINSDIPIVEAAFQGIHHQCEITEAEYTDTPLFNENIACSTQFRDYYPPPPYSHLFTDPGELTISPLETLIVSLSHLPEDTCGLYQVLFKGVDPLHNWHANVERLFDIEFAQKLNSGFQSMPQRFAQQGPTGDLRQMAWDVSSKAHNDKPFFAVSVRCVVFGAEKGGREFLQSVSSFMNFYQHGGRPLKILSDSDYKHFLNVEQKIEMFLSGLTYRPGFLLNSMELSGLVHLSSINFTLLRNIPVTKLEVKAGTTTPTDEGTSIGTFLYTGKLHEVKIAERDRRSTHLIGASGFGKTTTHVRLIMDDIENGHGVAVIDPHGDLSERILRLIPKEYVENVIYLDFGDDDWIPVWNPLSISHGIDIGRATSDFLSAIKSFISTTGWGDRLEYILGHVIYSTFHLPNVTMLDVMNILRRKPGYVEKIKEEILSVIDSKHTKEFWLNDFSNYPKDAFSPPINKLNKLFATKNVTYMLSNSQNKINFNEIMEEGKILIVNLSSLSREIQGFYGCFILSMLQLNTLARATKLTAGRKFDIHIDEVHRFAISDALETFIEEGRKFNVSVGFAHQRTSQFNYKKIDSFGGVGTSIIFNVNSRDAHHFAKNLSGQVKASEITKLEKYEAIVKSGGEVHKMNMLTPKKEPENNYRDEIIQQSHSQYYLPTKEVKRIIDGKQDKRLYAIQSSRFKHSEELANIKELPFDEFK